jgi:topoisomerase-4 subunit A
VTDDDVARLTEIRIKRISKYNSFKANEVIKTTEKEIRATKRSLRKLTEFTISYLQGLIDKYGKGRERRTRIDSFVTIKATEVALPTEKLYVNREDGFIGTGLKRDEFVEECTQLDDIICFCGDGTFRVSRVADKVYMGQDIIHVAVWKKGDEETIYDMVYRDGSRGDSYVKRFMVSGVTRDKVYDLTKGNKGSKVHYFRANLDGATRPIIVRLTQTSKARTKEFEYDFGELAIKGRGSNGNRLTKYAIKSVRSLFDTEMKRR